MHRNQKNIIAKAIGVFFRKVLFIGVVSILFTGCGKKDTVLFLEETLSQTQEETDTFIEREDMEISGTSAIETDNSQMKQAAEQTEIKMTAESCFVHICGAVKTPGVYELPEGSRIFEAVELAGGLTEEACGEYQNQAQKITDGMMIYIPTSEQKENGEVEEMLLKKKEAAKEADDVPDTSKVININTADKEMLMTLPGIGESRAESILSYREESGGFTKIEDIMKVPGIKKGAYQKLKDKICVD